MPNESKRRQKQEHNCDTRESFSFKNRFAVGATKVPLHRREIHRNSIWAHLNSASMVKDECPQLRISPGSSHTSAMSTELSMSYEYPGTFLLTAARLGWRHI